MPTLPSSAASSPDLAPLLSLALPPWTARFSGLFEAHLTVELGPLCSGEGFRAACAELGVRAVLIELDRGRVPTQPMTTSWHRGSLAEVAAELEALAGGLLARGFRVERAKVEALANGPGAPESCAEARLLPEGNYFEHHVKVAVSPGRELERLVDVAAEHRAHLSRNGWKALASGRELRFLTLRAHRAGRAVAEARFEGLLSALERAGLPASNRLREYCVLDTRAQLDEGWTTAE